MTSSKLPCRFGSSDIERGNKLVPGGEARRETIGDDGQLAVDSA